MTDDIDNEHFLEDYVDEQTETQVDSYDISAIPNDFNVLTISHFIESGSVKIPGFQRNYVWDIARASKLIESLIIGLPVPQIFLYEDARNSFLVIDGQQRLMTIYYFMKQRFPRKEKRAELRMIFSKTGSIPERILHDDTYFSSFKLKLATLDNDKKNIFHGLSYMTLGEYKTQFELRTIRNIVVKQNSPNDDDSSMYEVFNRLNTGGINLKPQEIRTSMYHSKFYEMLERLNSNDLWREILNLKSPSLHLKDQEVLLRSYAFCINRSSYRPSLAKFLNKFSKDTRRYHDDFTKELEHIGLSFFEIISKIGKNCFISKSTNKFNIALFESVFSISCFAYMTHKEFPELTIEKIRKIETDQNFVAALQEGTTRKDNIEKRLSVAERIING